jgi:hypothetical protein
MMSDSRSLTTLQRWMQQVITHPAGIAAGVESPEARREIPLDSDRIEQVIGRSRSLDSISRLAVYGNAYIARLTECLAEDFPALSHALGEETFLSFAMSYLQEHPSRNYSLVELGRNFPRYLADHRPDDIPAPGWPDFLIDLARVERLYCEVFDGPGVEGQTLLSVEELQSVPPESIGQLRLIPVPCLHLVELRFPVHEYLTAVRRGEAPEIPAPEPTWLVVTRREFVVRRGAVSQPEFLLLRALQEGACLEAAIAAAAEATSFDDETLAARLFGWFQHWTRAGWFLRIILPNF